MTVHDFVTLYWNKPKGKSGKNWDAGSVAEMEGISYSDALSFFTYCAHKNLPDDQLLALNPQVKITPFGLVISDGTPSGADLLDLTLDKVTLRQMLQAFNKAI